MSSILNHMSIYIGLFHGKDVRFGKSISHSHAKTNRRWDPNVINKRVWSFALNDWVRFKMTTTALKKIDNYGGVDNYLLALDENSVKDSNYVTKMRNLIASALYHQGKLDQRVIRRLGYHKNPPPMPNATSDQESGAEVAAAAAHLP
jgi:ribosomal protein L28